MISSHTRSQSELTETFNKKWLKYWSKNGYSIVHRSWIKNNQYLDLCNEFNRYLHIKNLTKNDHINRDNQKTLAELWEEHYMAEYTSTYYEWMEKHMPLQTVSSKISKIKKHSDDLQFDDSELKRLGLPISFGSSKNKKTLRKLYISNDMNESDNKNTSSESLDDTSTLKESESNSNATSKRKAKRRNERLKKMKSDLNYEKAPFKYWRKRYAFFSKYDEGIQLDEEGWFSVTPEKIAKHIAEKLKKQDVIVDGFCGCGGNTIQFAKKCKKVIAIDIDPLKISMAKNNAKIYNVQHNIEFIVGDFFNLCKNIKADAVFLSPPWGGPNYAKKLTFDIEVDLQPTAASELVKSARSISNNIAIFLPRNSDVSQVVSLAGVGGKVRIEKNFFGNKEVALTAFYGNIIDDSVE